MLQNYISCCFQPIKSFIMCFACGNPWPWAHPVQMAKPPVHEETIYLDENTSFYPDYRQVRENLTRRRDQRRDFTCASNHHAPNRQELHCLPSSHAHSSILCPTHNTSQLLKSTYHQRKPHRKHSLHIAQYRHHVYYVLHLQGTIPCDPQSSRCCTIRIDCTMAQIISIQL